MVDVFFMERTIRPIFFKSIEILSWILRCANAKSSIQQRGSPGSMCDASPDGGNLSSSEIKRRNNVPIDRKFGDVKAKGRLWDGTSPLRSLAFEATVMKSTMPLKDSLYDISEDGGS